MIHWQPIRAASFALAALLGTYAPSFHPPPAPSAAGEEPYLGILRGAESPPLTPPAAPSGPGGCEPQQEVANVILSSGEFHCSETDLVVRGRGLDFIWARRYRSGMERASALGPNWDFSYNISIEAQGNDLWLYDGNTRRDRYQARPGGYWAAREFFREGTFLAGGEFELIFADGGKWIFRPLDGSPAAGRILRIEDRNGNLLAFQYDGLGRLTTVIDTLGRAINIGYDANGWLATVTDFAGRQVAYTHYQDGDPGGSAGDLAAVRTPLVTGTPQGNDFPAGKVTTYSYSRGFSDARLNHNLLSITDPSGQTWLENTYAPNGAPPLLFDHLVEQRRGGASDTIEIVYLALAPKLVTDPNPAALRVIVNDPVGNVAEYFYDGRRRLVMQREYTGRAPDPGAPTTDTLNRPQNPLRPEDPPYFESRWEFNVDSLVSRSVFPDGNEERRKYERDLNASAPWRARGNLRERRRLPGTHLPAGDQTAILELYEYEPGFGGCCGTNFVTRQTDGRGNLTEHFYDVRGNRTRTVHRVPSAVEDYEYDAFGRLVAHVLPNNGSGHRRRDTYQYYGPADGAQNGYMKSVVVDDGGLALTTRYEYDGLGRVIRQIDPKGADELYDYNALDQIVRERSRETATGSGVRYAILTWYDANDNVIRVDVENKDETGAVDPNPLRTTTYAYDVLDRKVQEVREIDATRSAITEWAYDANRNPILVRKGAATGGVQPENTVAVAWDERDRLFTVTRAPASASASTTRLTWWGNGVLAKRETGLEDGAHATNYVYDGYDRVVRATDAMGNVCEYHYDANGNRGGDQSTGIPNPFGVRISGELLDAPGSSGNVRLYEAQYAYDALDRVVQREIAHFEAATQADIDDGAQTTKYAYSDSTQIVQAIDDQSRVWTWQYDRANRMSAVEDPEQNRIAYEYDANGNLIQKTEQDVSGLGNPTQVFATIYEYDGLDRLVRSVDPAGNDHISAYDSRSNVVLHTDALGRATRYEYDGLDRPVRQRHDMTGDGFFDDPDDVATLLEWDDSSRLTAAIDDNGNTTRYSYDALDRRIVTQFADGTLDQIGEGAAWVLGSDAPDLTSFTSGWDAHDRAAVSGDAAGSRIASNHDALDRLTLRTIARGPFVEGTALETYAYDGLSRLVRAQDEDSLLTIAYDSLAQVLQETQQVQSAPPRLVRSLYDASGNQRQLEYPGGRVIQRTFDGLDRPLVVIDPSLGMLASYAYIGRTRIERRDFGNGTRFAPSWDGVLPNAPGDFGVRRLVRSLHTRIADGATLSDRTYGWDRMLNKSLADDALDPSSSASYAYDGLDRLVHSERLWSGEIVDYIIDGTGNRRVVNGGPNPGVYGCDPTLPEPADCQVDQYSATPFDARAFDKNGNLASTLPSSSSYFYDYRNRLVRYFDGDTSVTTLYAYDVLGRRVARSSGGTIQRYYYDRSDEIEEQSSTGVTLATNVYSAGSDNRIAGRRSGNNYYFHEDDQGSVVAVSNSSGAVIERIVYDDFGSPTQVADAILLQGPNQVRGADSDRDQNPFGQATAVAESFAVNQSTTLASLSWEGGYDYFNQAPPADQFTVRVHADAGGVPGSVLYVEFLGNVQRAATGGQFQGFIGSLAEFRYSATLANPFHAQAGLTYWISIVNDTSGHPSTWQWEESSDGDGRSAFSVNFGPWNLMPGDRACELFAAAGNSENPFLYAGMRWDKETRTYLVDVGRLDGSCVQYEPRTGRPLQTAARGIERQEVDQFPIADFFHPGSEPFSAVTGPPSVRFFNERETVVIGPPETIPIELVSLSLVSCNPIPRVSPEPWSSIPFTSIGAHNALNAASMVVMQDPECPDCARRRRNGCVPPSSYWGTGNWAHFWDVVIHGIHVHPGAPPKPRPGAGGDRTPVPGTSGGGAADLPMAPENSPFSGGQRPRTGPGEGGPNGSEPWPSAPNPEATGQKTPTPKPAADPRTCCCWDCSKITGGPRAGQVVYEHETKVLATKDCDQACKDLHQGWFGGYDGACDVETTRQHCVGKLRERVPRENFFPKR